ncbi:MAG: hypothetical protein US24_C0046G0004 [candidate division WS6 bacterium GW2011_GWC2_36_7]|uniref:Uncharacterized protein n=2 Tax=Candidatus Dojkabacteria TaxID=74243 RepID=A0A0G0FFX3_9BACT|nr:MAG: hypothetical protein US14_C0034G0001 [candidate division WS6 bacterium GW2011_WS6_36_26]KKQ11021.1 MAG: hypothetical protein US24_C0046G0004 [candidate division WS6 bacterium GW2011_GWC2_36_7]KKQ18008.1 MAG: hypothetical protein US29_C0001G0009 [candidate division WS6 bacterium GW2011_GWF1_36_8]HAM37235.1 hypothetical protein [Patescibacteria group bacterium]HAM96465.1 hypothetical protein [Patescibacteria group bacterium]
MAEEKKAKKIFTLEEIKYNEKNQWMGVLACIPIVGLILMFVEKDDNFVRYMGAQYTLVGVLQFFSWVPVIGWLLAPVTVVLILVGMFKAYKGERFDVPVISGLGLKLLSAI